MENVTEMESKKKNIKRFIKNFWKNLNKIFKKIESLKKDEFHQSTILKKKMQMSQIFKSIPKKDIKLLKDKTFVILDMEYYHNKDSRPDTLKDTIEITQIGMITTNLDPNKVLKVEDFNCFVKPVELTPKTLKKEFYENLVNITKLDYEFLMKNGLDLDIAIEKMLDYIKDYPIVIMKGDAEVLFNNTLKRFGKGLEINDKNDVFILFRYLESMFEEMGIQKTKENLGKCSGELHTLLEEPLKIEAHNALNDAKSMSYFIQKYFEILK